MEYNTLGLVYTNKCTGECDICCFSCSPRRNEKLDVDISKRIIREAAMCGFKILGITGGEPFLYYQEILQLVKEANQCLMQSTITTNCYWAINEQIVRERFHELKMHGTRSIKISIDQYHLEHVALKNIKLVLKVSKQVGLRVVVGCTITKRASKTGDILNLFDDELADIAFYEHKCYPLGNGSTKLDNGEIYTTKEINNNCREGGTLTIMPDYNVYPCGSMCGIIEERRVGNIKSEKIKDILNNLINDKLNTYTRANGIRPYLNHIYSKHPSILNNDDEYVDACHACYTIFTTVKDEVLREVLEN